MLLIDTNVLVDVLQDDPRWAEWSIGQLRTQARLHEFVINPIVYAEFSLSFDTLEEVESAMGTMKIALRELPRAALFLAGKAFQRYRRSGGTRTQVLPDFLIGAHAAAERWPLLTRDAARFRTHFPTVEVIAP